MRTRARTHIGKYFLCEKRGETFCGKCPHVYSLTPHYIHMYARSTAWPSKSSAWCAKHGDLLLFLCWQRNSNKCQQNIDVELYDYQNDLDGRVGLLLSCQHPHRVDLWVEIWTSLGLHGDQDPILWSSWTQVGTRQEHAKEEQKSATFSVCVLFPP